MLLETRIIRVSVHGNFGDLLNYQNIKKSIMEAKFMSPGHMLYTTKQAFDAIHDNFRKKDF